jgi:hypothetical protein
MSKFAEGATASESKAKTKAKAKRKARLIISVFGMNERVGGVAMSRTA